MLWSFLTRWWICRWFLCVCQRLLVTEPEKVWGGGDNIWRFAQKNNNYNSVTVTLRCGLLFAPSVTTGRSQGAVREALQMTMWRVGVMERFSKAWDSSTLPLMVLAVWIYAQIIICTGRTKMTLFPLLEKRKIVSFCLLLFASRVFRKRSGDVTSLFADICLPPAVQSGFCSFEFVNRPNIYMQNHNCSAWEGKHPRLGCKIAALLASVIIPEAS